MLFRTLVFLLAVTLAASQSTDAVCMPEWTWTSNSLGQNPCLVASYLKSVCYTAANIPALLPGYHYIGPYKGSDTFCMCSTVTYSLMSACGLCQNATIIYWSDWSFNCTMKYNEIYPGAIPPGTSVPAWAYLDVTPSDIFNPALAKQYTGFPESSATYLPTSTSSKPTETTLPGTSLRAASPTATPTDAQSKKKSSTGPIVGGVIGGLVGLALIVAFIVTILYIIRRRRRTAQTAPSPYGNQYVNSPQMTHSAQYDPNRMSHLPAMSPQKHYDPSDPSTFPTTPLTPNTIYTTGSPVPIIG